MRNQFASGRLGGVIKRSILALVAASLAVGAAATTASAATSVRSKGAVKQGFIGTNMNPTELRSRHISLAVEIDRAAAAGVEQIRFPLYWSNIQAFKRGSYDWRELDSFVTLATAKKIKLLPTLIGAPEWAAEDLSVSSHVTKTKIPSEANFVRFAAFAKAAAARYGSGGSFATAKTNPITVWQVWNEPDHAQFWPQVRDSACTKSKPRTPAGGKVLPKLDAKQKLVCWYTEVPRKWAPEYVKMLKFVRGAPATMVGSKTVPGTGLLGGDPNTKVMLTSFTSAGPYSLALVYGAINASYRSIGPAGFFDRAGVNVFPSNTRLEDYGTKIKAFKDAMTKAKDVTASGAPRAPIYLTEFAWLSGRCDTKVASYIYKGPACSKITYFGQLETMVVTENKQADLASRSLTYLANPRNSLPLEGVFWFTWMTSDSSSNLPWEYAGLNCYDCYKNVLTKATVTVIVKKKPTKVMQTTITRSLVHGAFRKESYYGFQAKSLALEGCKAKLLADRCSK